MSLSQATDTMVATVSRSRVSWGAILAGLVMALIVHTLLNCLSLAWGLSSLRLSEDGLRTTGFNVFLWLLLNNVFAMFAGGWVASHLSASKKSTDAVLHGLLAWATTSLLNMFLVIVLAGTVLSGTLNLLGSGLAWAGSSATELVKVSQPATAVLQRVTPPDWRSAFDTVEHSAEQVIDLAQKNVASSNADKEQVHQQLSQLLMDLLHNSSDLAHHVTEQELNDFLTQHTELDQTQAEKLINNWQASFDDLKNTLDQKAADAKQAASVAVDQGSSAMGIVALMSFFILLSGGIAAGLGAAFGRMR